MIYPICLLALVSIGLICNSTVSAQKAETVNNYSIALFWPDLGVAKDADTMFRNIFQPRLLEMCLGQGVALPTDFVVNFHEFYMGTTKPNYAMLNSFAKKVNNTSVKFHFSGITAAPEAEDTKRLVRGMGEFRLHTMDPPPLRAMAPVLFNVVKLVQIGAFNASSFDLVENRQLIVVVGLPYRLQDVQHMFRSFEFGVLCFSLDKAVNLSLYLQTISNTYITTILLIARREDAKRFIYGALDGTLWNPDYRWILYDSGLVYEVKPNILPSNARNISAIEFGEYSSTVAEYLTSTNHVMLYDLLSIWTRYMANISCGVRMDNPSFRGLSGLFNVWPNLTVERQDWTMMIHRSVLGDVRTVGNFSTSGSLNMLTPRPRVTTRAAILGEFQRLNLGVFVLMNNPYVRYKKGMENMTDIDLRYRLEGMAFDLCMEILANLGLTNITINLQADKSHGSLQSDGNWNGLVRSLIDGSADIACADLSITGARSDVVDFSTSYLRTNLSILYKLNKTDPNRELFQFMFPFSFQLWLYIGGSILLVALVLAVLHRIHPNEQLFDLHYSVFFSAASMLQGIVGRTPSRPSGQIVVMFYWLMVTLILIAYVSNYAAMRTLNKLETDIKTVPHLLDQSSYTYGILANTSTVALFRDSTFADMKRIYESMKRFRLGFYNNTEVAVAAVRQGNFAMIYNTPANEYAQQLICDSVVTGHFENIDLAIGFPRRSDLRSIVSDEIRSLQANGRLNELYRKYFVIPKSELPACSTKTLAAMLPEEPAVLQPDVDALTLRNTFGLLIVNVVGCCITLIVAGIERRWSAFRAKAKQSQDEMEVDTFTISDRRKSRAMSIAWNLESAA